MLKNQVLSSICKLQQINSSYAVSNEKGANNVFSSKSAPNIDFWSYHTHVQQRRESSQLLEFEHYGNKHVESGLIATHNSVQKILFS